jgi:hypothetical protein
VKLKLTRRRILIAAIAVVGILVVWWALLPRVDQRFVGTWQILGTPDQRITFSPDGSFTNGSYGPGSRWWIHGDDLVVYDASGDRVRDEFAVFWFHYNLILGRGPLERFGRMHILEVSERRATFDGDFGEVKLQRVPH